jgi:hypothetical protein
MRVLFVAPWIPSPLRPRSLSLLDALSVDHEVHFLAPVRTKADSLLAKQLTGCASVTLVRDARWRSLVRAALALLRGKSLQTGYASSAAMRRGFKTAIDNLDPDAVHFNVFRTAHLVPLAGDRALVMDLDEYRSEYYEQLAAQHPRPLWRAIGRYESVRMADGERQLKSRGCAILLSKSSATAAPENVFEVPSVSLLPPLVSPAISGTEKSVVFVGRFTYEANRDAVRWFVEKCWDDVVAEVADARLFLVGDRPPRDIARLAGPTISVTGPVVSTAPYYERAAVVIAPIRLATGVQMKLIEGLSYGKPVVCSPIVARLAAVRDGEEVLVASSPQEWVMAVVTLLRNSQTAASIAVRGRSWIEENHSREAQRAFLTQAYTWAVQRTTRVTS